MDVSKIQPNKEIALMLAKRSVAEFVYDAVNLEGINFTLPEVQTLLDGVTIGGHPVSDQDITLNQAQAWKFIFSAIETDTFAMRKDFVCGLHEIAAHNEVLKWGQFRDAGVTISGTDYMPPHADQLNLEWANLVTESEKIDAIYDRAIYIFLRMARTQFFFDVNKRMGRFIMNGLLLSAGYLAINLPAKKQLEFNELMLDFYASDDVGPMTEFMKSCLDPRVIALFV